MDPQLKRHEPLYLKHRPQALDELVGQESVRRTLTNAINFDRISHAYLFTGPRGTGKTSSARILAKSLNCKAGEKATVSPCQECTSCLEIKNGNSPAVFEIDAASNNSVDDARVLIERAPLVAPGGRYKIYIIDECHMLTKEAFNALLKTIEDPPANVVFILATTEEHKVIPTIVSRCQRLMFRLVQQEDLLAHLRNVADKEGIEITDRAIDFVARRSGGGLRDALGLLDQASLLSAPGKPVDVAELLTLLGALNEDALLEMSLCVLERRGHDLLNAANKLLRDGREPAIVVQELARHFLNLAKASYLAGSPQNDEASARLIAGSPDYVAALYNQAPRFERSELSQLVETLDRLEQTCRRTTQPGMHLEVGLLALCHRQDMIIVRELANRVSQLERALAGGAQISQSHAPAGASRPAGAGGAYQQQPARPAVQPGSQPAHTAQSHPNFDQSGYRSAEHGGPTRNGDPSATASQPRSGEHATSAAGNRANDHDRGNSAPHAVSPPGSARGGAAPASGSQADAVPSSGSSADAVPSSDSSVGALAPSGSPVGAVPASGSSVSAVPASGSSVSAVPASGSSVSAVPASSSPFDAVPPPFGSPVSTTSTSGAGTVPASRTQTDQFEQSSATLPAGMSHAQAAFGIPAPNNGSSTAKGQTAHLQQTPPKTTTQADPLKEEISGDPGNAFSADEVDRVWGDLLTELQRRHIPTFSLLSGQGFPISVSDKELVIGVSAESWQKTLETRIEHVKSAIASVMGRPLFVKFKVVVRDAAVRNAAPRERSMASTSSAGRGGSGAPGPDGDEEYESSGRSGGHRPSYASATEISPPVRNLPPPSSLPPEAFDRSADTAVNPALFANDTGRPTVPPQQERSAQMTALQTKPAQENQGDGLTTEELAARTSNNNTGTIIKEAYKLFEGPGSRLIGS